MAITDNPVRYDSQGSGNIAAPRGGRVHKGVDFEIVPGHFVESPIEGTVSRIIQCYSDTEDYKGVEIIGTDELGRKQVWKFLYLKPMVGPGDHIAKEEAIGVAQDISKRYSAQMLPHIHVEVTPDPRSLLTST